MRGLKLIATLGVFVASTVAANAQYTRGARAYDFDSDTNIRVGTYCRVTIYGDDVYDGLCNVSRESGSNVTVINTGRKSYRIVRDEFDKREAEFYSGRELIGTVYAQGSCWKGPNSRYCAK